MPIVLLIQIVAGAVVTLIVPNISYWFVYICPFYRLGDFVIGACIGEKWLEKSLIEY